MLIVTSNRTVSVLSQVNSRELEHFFRDRTKTALLHYKRGTQNKLMFKIDYLTFIQKQTTISVPEKVK